MLARAANAYVSQHSRLFVPYLFAKGKRIARSTTPSSRWVSVGDNQASAEGIGLGNFVKRTASSEGAFDEMKAVDRPGVGREAGVATDPGLGPSRAIPAAREGDVRQI